MEWHQQPLSATARYWRRHGSHGGVQLPTKDEPDLTDLDWSMFAEISTDDFVRRFQRYKPNVMIAPDSGAINWRESRGAKVPATHEFLSLNVWLKNRRARVVTSSRGCSASHGQTSDRPGAAR